MNQKRMGYILAIEAMVCIIFCLIQINFSWIFSAAVAFPFEQLGYGLRWLSLSGTIGNITAILLYSLTSLVPCIIWYSLKWTQRMLKMDCLLLPLSILLFVVNYYMINPGMLQSTIEGTGKWMLGSTFYSALAGYLIIRILKVYHHADSQKLRNGLIRLLGLLNMIFIYIIFGPSLKNLIDTIGKVQGGNSLTGMDGFAFNMAELGATYLFLALHYLVNILPYLLNIGIAVLTARALTALNENRYSDEAANAVNRLAGSCVNALKITIAADVVFNLLQLIFHRRLYRMDIVIHIPVVSILFVFAVLLLAKYVQENQKLKQDNDLFI